MRNESSSEIRRLATADIVLAAVVVAVVGLMVVPLPTWLLDLLISANLAAAVAILLVSVFVLSPLDLATFPTLLLLTTLVRLGLNVSSTRLILLQADAGTVIYAFGAVVVRGNYVVGAVVFAILTVIQFVVIAKGSERIAEVGARFILDAMPGKQLSIDAELRSGLIDAAEARRQRRRLDRESQLYGAMDGAMKFVKGDAIASLFIIVVNLVGGLTIGVLQRGLSWQEALRRYGLLTIGDGLVSQIPALLLATAAGILVTRVTSEDRPIPLGSELSRQLLSTPRALSVAGLFFAALAVVPGLPGLPFLTVGIGLVVASYLRTQRGAASSTTGSDPYASRGGLDPRFVPAMAPWTLALGTHLAPLLHARQGRASAPQLHPRSLEEAAADAREALFETLGVPLPPADLRLDASLPPLALELRVRGVPVWRRELLLSSATPAASALSDLDAVARDLQSALADHAAELLGLDETQSLLERLARQSPAVVRQVVPVRVELPLLTDVLRHLLDETVSIRDLGPILEALARAPTPQQSATSLADWVRGCLRRPLTHSLTSGSASLGVYLLDPQIEDALEDAVTDTPSGPLLGLAPRACRDIVLAIRRALPAAPAASAALCSERGAGAAATVPLVILTRPRLRRHVRDLLGPDLRRVRVVCASELLPETHLEALGTATLTGL